MPRKKQEKQPVEVELAPFVPNPQIEITPNGWVLPNRIKFTSWIPETFNYQGKAVSGSNLFPYQRFIKDYIQPASPYRGILLMHGLGLGKTCSSVVASENMIGEMGVVVMLPASLEKNYIKDVKTRCGNVYFSTNQRFVFRPLKDIKNEIDAISSATFVPAKIIRKNKGIWLPTPGQTNFEEMTSDQKEAINLQLNSIVQTKYNFIHYNGLSSKKIDEFEKNNPFANKLVIIDEVHNFISRTVGAGIIGKRMYNLLMDAPNCRIIALSGTPIINHPHELAFLTNMLAGRKMTHTLYLRDVKDAESVLESSPYVDRYELDASKKEAHVQFLPNGFRYSNKPSLLVTKASTNTSDEKILDDLVSRLRCSKPPKTTSQFQLPFDQTEFADTFIDMEATKVKNPRMLVRRLMGHISYFGTYYGDMYPQVLPIKAIELDMSDEMFKMYEENRLVEIKQESSSRRNKARAGGMNAFDKVSQVYRAYSRLACNFVFPAKIKRPFPGKMNAMNNEISTEDSDGSLDLDKKNEYTKKILQALSKLKESKDVLSLEHLAKYSPKFEKIIRSANQCSGKVLVYSQFRLVEGLGVLAIALEANGWCELRLTHNTNGEWEVSCDDPNKPRFFQFRGNTEETQVMMDIFNNEYSKVPQSVLDQLQALDKDNLHGHVLKLAMITQSGAEGISLKHVREVHIVEPYWNEIRISQVIGRAVRAGSHIELPKSERTVQVYRYVIRISAKHVKDSKTIKNKDNGISTDQHIFQIAERKAKIIKSFEDVVKSAAVDCLIHSKYHPDVKCLSFPVNANPSDYTYAMDMSKDETDEEYDQRVKVVQKVVPGKFRECSLNGVKYAYNNDNHTLYDLEAYNQGKIVKISTLVKRVDGWRMS